jgi:putative membrane protein
LPHHPAENAGAFAAIAARYAGLAMVVTGIAVIARSCMGFARTRRAIDREELIRIPQSRDESLLSGALVIAVVISCLYLAVI